MASQKLINPRVVAVGEIGVDATFYEKVSQKEQVRVFELQIKVAKKMQLPICIHLRGDVVQEAECILEESGLPLTWNIHMHCFTYSLAVMERWRDKWPNMKFRLVPNYFDVEVGRCIDLDNLLLETDAPYFLPKICRDTLDGNGFKFPQQNSYLKIYPSSIEKNKATSIGADESSEKSVLEWEAYLSSDGNQGDKSEDFKKSASSCKIAVPGMVFHVAQQLAILRNISVDEILAKNRANIEQCYGLTPNMVLGEEHKPKDKDKLKKCRHYADQISDPLTDTTENYNKYKSRLYVESKTINILRKPLITSRASIAQRDRNILDDTPVCDLNLYKYEGAIMNNTDYLECFQINP